MNDLSDLHIPGPALSRREFVASAGGAAVGLSALGLPAGSALAATPNYGGSIKIGLRSDISRLDPHPPVSSLPHIQRHGAAV